MHGEESPRDGTWGDEMLLLAALSTHYALLVSLMTPRFPNETSVLAMRGDCDVAELELGLIRVEKHRSESSRSAPSHALAVAHAGNGQTGTTGTGGGTRGRGRKGRRSGGRHDDGGGRHQQGHPQMHQQQQQQQHQPPAAMSQQSYAWQQQQQQQQYQPPFSEGPHHHQPNPWSSWGRPPHQQQQGRAHHQRRSRHRGGHQAHQQRVMCRQCGKEEHFPADCVITMPAPAPQHTAPFSGARTAQYGTGAHAAQQYSTGAHVAQYGTHPLPTWTPPDNSPVHVTVLLIDSTSPPICRIDSIPNSLISNIISLRP